MVVMLVVFGLVSFVEVFIAGGDFFEARSVGGQFGGVRWWWFGSGRMAGTVGQYVGEATGSGWLFGRVDQFGGGVVRGGWGLDGRFLWFTSGGNGSVEFVAIVFVAFVEFLFGDFLDEEAILGLLLGGIGFLVDDVVDGGEGVVVVGGWGFRF